MPVDVLLLCTGNLCRSPLAEHLLRARLAGRGIAHEVAIRSAGTLARRGDPMHPHALAVLAARGIDGSGFQTTPLDERAVAGADVVVGMAREHRAAAVSLRPALVNGAFTLGELAHQRDHRATHDSCGGS